jgi:hypothetical protein
MHAHIIEDHVQVLGLELRLFRMKSCEISPPHLLPDITFVAYMLLFTR